MQGNIAYKRTKVAGTLSRTMVTNKCRKRWQKLVSLSWASFGQEKEATTFPLIKLEITTLNKEKRNLKITHHCHNENIC
jgi:hypothetical protein